MTYYAALTFAACVSAQENVYVGSIVTPAAGASGTTGAGVGGSGGSGTVASGSIWLSTSGSSRAVNWTSSAGGDSLQVRGWYGTVGTPNVGTWQYVGGLATNEPGGTTTYTYMVVVTTALGVFASDTCTTSQGSSALNGTYYNAINWPAYPGALHYDVYRIAGGTTQGKIFIRAGSYWWTGVNDTGLTGDGFPAPNRWMNLATGPSGSADVTGYETNAVSYGTVVTWELYDVTEQLVLAQVT